MRVFLFLGVCLLAACASETPGGGRGRSDGSSGNGGSGTGGSGAGGIPGIGGNSPLLDGGAPVLDASDKPFRDFEDCTGDKTCGEGLACRYDLCVPDPSPCTNGDECIQDAYCDEGECIPFGVPTGADRDESCRVAITVNALEPEVQCRWERPPAGDATPSHFNVMATPVAVDFDFDDNPGTLHPSIVFASWGPEYVTPGSLRVVDGNDCTQQFTLSTSVMSAASAAVGDLNGDGRPDVVAAKYNGGLMAFQYNSATKQFDPLFTSTDLTGGTDKWNGPQIHDLDDDGIAEIVYGATVYDNTGKILNGTLGLPTGGNNSSLIQGYISVVADVDEDGKMELVQGNAIHEWDVAAKSWVAETYFKSAGLTNGQVAVADFGDHPIAALGGKDVAEIVVIEGGIARVQTVEGTVIKSITVPGSGRCGPPTVADFDGDGRAEFATANGTKYAVFDLDCKAADATCEGDGVLWTETSQDASSNVTGSSVFDFDGDGAAEVVYADECFLRIYEGATGKVTYSAARSSATAYENPIILDVDGDFNTEIVAAMTAYTGCPATDPLFPTASFEAKTGIVVLRDKQDRWAASRPVWNQHAYAVTHVGDRGETPKTSAVKHNWREPSLNNFRQNVQGELEPDGQQDLTVSGKANKIQCEGTVANLQAEVCNRGTKPMASGTKVSFRKGEETGPELCSIPIAEILDVARCTEVTCEADLGMEHIDMTVVVDPDNESAECWENNNTGFFREVACGEVPVPELPVVL